MSDRAHREKIPSIMTTDLSTPRLNGEVGVLSTSLALSNGPSDHFIPTLALRDKTLGDLLNPTNQSNSKTHHCEDSNATFASSSEEIEADHGNDIHLQHAQLNTTGMTYVESSCTKRGNTNALSEARKKEMSSAGEVNPEHLDPTPFAFKPCELAQMLDSKNLEHLESLGGPQGQFRGLGKTQRLSAEDKVLILPSVTAVAQQEVNIIQDQVEQVKAADVDDTALLEPGLASSRVGKGCPTTGDKLIVSGGAGLTGEAYLHHCEYGDANTSGRLGGYMTQAPFISGRSKTTTNAEEPTCELDPKSPDKRTGLREGRRTTGDGSVGADSGPGFTASQSYGRDSGPLVIDDSPILMPGSSSTSLDSLVRRDSPQSHILDDIRISDHSPAVTRPTSSSTPPAASPRGSETRELLEAQPPIARPRLAVLRDRPQRASTTSAAVQNMLEALTGTPRAAAQLPSVPRTRDWTKPELLIALLALVLTFVSTVVTGLSLQAAKTANPK